MTKWFSLESFQQLCFDLAQNATWTSDEPIPDFSTRYSGRLEACLDTPRQTFDEQLLYPSLIDQGAILFYLLIKDHPFTNGNKRIAVTALMVFLFLNGKWISVEQDELYRLTVSVAASDARQKEEVVREVKGFIQAHITNVAHPDSLPPPVALASDPGRLHSSSL